LRFQNARAFGEWSLCGEDDSADLAPASKNVNTSLFSGTKFTEAKLTAAEATREFVCFELRFIDVEGAVILQ
jgi:hypothetical protein